MNKSQSLGIRGGGEQNPKNIQIYFWGPGTKICDWQLNNPVSLLSPVFHWSFCGPFFLRRCLWIGLDEECRRFIDVISLGVANFIDSVTSLRSSGSSADRVADQEVTQKSSTNNVQRATFESYQQCVFFLFADLFISYKSQLMQQLTQHRACVKKCSFCWLMRYGLGVVLVFSYMYYTASLCIVQSLCVCVVQSLSLCVVQNLYVCVLSVCVSGTEFGCVQYRDCGWFIPKIRTSGIRISQLIE